MRKIFLYFCFMLFSAFVFSQSKIGYAYDMAGNRIKREIVMSASQAMAKKQSFESQDFYSERLREHSVKIYPNPTQGNLKVSISGLENSDKCHLDVYSIQGTQILAFDVNSDNANVDISNQPNGVYMLQITINGKSTTWKIIKK